MINLLPPNIKETYRYGRRNYALMHWIVITLLCLVGGVLLTGGGYIYLNHGINATDQQIASTDNQLASESQGSVQKQVTTISNNLKLAEQVLSKEILFSKLLKQLAAVTPSNVLLTGLSIDQTQGGLEISAVSSSYQAASQLQVNLADPKNEIFSQADIESITCNGTSTQAGYPCTVNIRALFAKDNPFLFINSGKAAS